MTPTLRTGRSRYSRRIQPSHSPSSAWTSRPKFTDTISSVVSCTSTNKLHERISAPYGQMTSANRAMMQDISTPVCWLSYGRGVVSHPVPVTGSHLPFTTPSITCCTVCTTTPLAASAWRKSRKALNSSGEIT